MRARKSMPHSLRNMTQAICDIAITIATFANQSVWMFEQQPALLFYISSDIEYCIASMVIYMYFINVQIYLANENSTANLIIKCHSCLLSMVNTPEQLLHMIHIYEIPHDKSCIFRLSLSRHQLLGVVLAKAESL